MQTKIMTVTPALAQAWLASNENNRKLNFRRARQLADTILDGHWRTNGESIKISKTGRLLDGQHRLTAVVVANQPIESCVTYGVPDEVFNTMDQGAKRSAADVLGIHGIANSTAVAATAGLAFRVLSGQPMAAYFKAGTNTTDIEDFVFENPEIADAVRQGERAKKTFKNAQIISTVWFMAQRIDRKLADEFIELLIRGDNMPMNHPVKVLRERLFADMGATAKLPKLSVFAFFIKAWNAFREGRSIRILRWTEDEPFPVME